jgi:uncharacterized membrane protein YphA (DoxX/SURF4 family)
LYFVLGGLYKTDGSEADIRASSDTSGLREWGITVLRVGTGASFLMHDGVTFLHKILYTPDDLFSLRAGEVGLLSLCAAALMCGLFTRWVSAVLAMSMLVNLLFIHWPSNFFEGVSNDSGFEYASLRLSASLALVLVGPGRAAVGNLPVLRRVPVIALLQR